MMEFHYLRMCIANDVHHEHMPPALSWHFGADTKTKYGFTIASPKCKLRPKLTVTSKKKQA